MVSHYKHIFDIFLLTSNNISGASPMRYLTSELPVNYDTNYQEIIHHDRSPDIYTHNEHYKTINQCIYTIFQWHEDL
jgi:hypothetical protein